jgi:protein SCO1/2
MPPVRSRSIALCSLALLAAAGCGGHAASVTQNGGSAAYRGLAVVDPGPAPPIALRDQDGRMVRLAAAHGSFTVVAFLYTHCPDVCPLIADHLNEAARELAARGQPIRILAVSVDPQRDTPAAVRRFVRAHRLVPRFRYLRGSEAELKPVWRAYHVAVDPTNGSALDHSAFEILVDRAGIERVYYTSTVSSADVVHDVEQLAKT